MLTRNRPIAPALDKGKQLETMFNDFQPLTTVIAKAPSQIWRVSKISLCSEHWKVNFIIKKFFGGKWNGCLTFIFYLKFFFFIFV